MTISRRRRLHRRRSQRHGRRFWLTGLAMLVVLTLPSIYIITHYRVVRMPDGWQVMTLTEFQNLP